MEELRPCVVRMEGSVLPAKFHKWVETHKKHIKSNHDFQLELVHGALVEFEDGSCGIVTPVSKIRFSDIPPSKVEMHFEDLTWPDFKNIESWADSLERGNLKIFTDAYNFNIIIEKSNTTYLNMSGYTFKVYTRDHSDICLWTHLAAFPKNTFSSLLPQELDVMIAIFKGLKLPMKPLTDGINKVRDKA